MKDRMFFTENIFIQIKYNFQFLGNSSINSSTSGYINWPKKIESLKVPDNTVAFADCMGTSAGKSYSARLPYDSVLQNGASNGDSKIGNHAWALEPPRLVAGSCDFCNDSTRTPASRSAPYPVHSPKVANIAFCDGHVEAQSLQELGYEVNADGSIGIKGTNRMFSGSGADEEPPAIN